MGRIVGIDIARGIAILGMFVLHAIPETTANPFGNAFLGLFGDQRAQVLFAVLDGVALGILSGAGGTQADRTSQRKVIGIRGLFLIALGLFLSSLGSGIVVILDYYGIYFLLCIPLLYQRIRVVGIVCASSLVLGPGIATTARDWIGDPSAPGFAILPPLIDRVASWTLVGQYPAIQWIGYVLAGLIIYRLGIVRRKFQFSVLAGGIATGICASLISDNLHEVVLSQTLTLVASVGWVVAVLAACMVFAEFGPVARLLRSLPVTPLAALGRMPVTIYAVHVLFFAFLAHYYTASGIQSIQTWLILTVGGILFATAWSTFLGRGPLERAIRLFLTQPHTTVVAKLAVQGEHHGRERANR
ncbi:hypothetical protein C3B59_05900 [Cryobacterium zongtaii]|uniref:DUF418 domain-containing protein n=1 Tax=Cryobacterium zongtaii TaxID=1259217 RepID=A0A2S3ZM69_9MICO|nr:DUF418 domain-containing protein [Cryobacterium zongtaii]POH69170.1 hypothetical protein C3B59_05900 [Cryobacterium zongtaii]